MFASETLFFTSSMFPMEPGEDSATNPGMFGKSLALWLGQQFVSPTFSVDDIVPEDFGWCVFIPGHPHTLFIACVSTNPDNREWGVFVAATGGWLSRLLGKSKHEESVATTYAAVRQAIESLPDARILDDADLACKRDFDEPVAQTSFHNTGVNTNQAEEFDAALLSDSPFLRWSLSPVVSLFGITLPLLVEKRTPEAIAAMAVMEFMCIALLAGFWLPRRYRSWAFRSLAGTVFLAYAAYLVFEFFFSETPFRISERRSEASPRNALLGFFIFGLPCLCYALLGRFSLRKPRMQPASDETDTS